MKRFLCLAMSLTLCGFATIGIHAAQGVSSEEQKILDALTAGIEVDGVQVYTPEEYIDQAKHYLYENEITAEQVSVILQEIENVKEIMKQHAITNLMQINGSVATEIFSHAQAAVKTIDVMLKLRADHTIGVYAKNGELLFTVNQNAVVQSSDDYTIMYIVTGVIALLLAGTGMIARRKKSFKE